MKYSVITFGCRVNQADSLGIEEDFLARGDVAAPPEESDVVIVNTCSVTASADQAARQTIRRVARVNPNAKNVVTGCYASRRPDDLVELPGVIRVVSNDDKGRLVPLVVPLTLFQHYVRKHRIAYLERQVYLNPHPVELMLRNHV